MKEYKLPEDRLPDPIRNFIDNNPKMKYEGLYLCQSVDMDGNILDTKIGVNLMTNYGLKDRYVTGTNAMASGAGSNMVKIWLGDSDAAIDPSSSQLTSYISALGEGSGLAWIDSDYPLEYDSTTGLWSRTFSIVQMYWDYTAGSNNEYVIKEIGMGKTRTTLWTHALIYDEHGDPSSIVKRPNTRLYVTTFITASLKVSDIQQMYLENKFLLMTPYSASPVGSLGSLYWRPLSRGKSWIRSKGSYWTEYNEYKAYSFDRKSVSTSDPREVEHSKGPGSSSTYFWQNNYWYTFGWLISSETLKMDALWGKDPVDPNISCVVYFQMDTPEELESYWCYVDKGYGVAIGAKANSTYTGVECEDSALWNIDETFGYSPDYKRRDFNTPTDWTFTGGELPCVQFDISELNLYNYISKQWDVQVPYSNQPYRRYDANLWCRLYRSMKFTIDGTDKTVHVYCNMFPHDQQGVPLFPITAFDNSGIVICATDEYWDPSTFVQIPNLGSVPAELQKKRYYIITSGSATILSPIWTAPEGYKKHSITRRPFELTHDTTGCMSQYPWYDCHNGFNRVAPYTGEKRYYIDPETWTLGSVPLVSTTKGFFCIGYKLFWADASWNITEYELLLEDMYAPDKFRRWMTRNEDRIVAFHTRLSTQIVNHVPASSTTTLSYNKAANYFGVWTIVDDSTTPTCVEFDLSTMWSDSSVVSNDTCWHRYSWSDLGYLVVAKRRTETEFVWVDIYAENGPEMHLITNAQHANVVERTNKVVYLDTNLSDDSTYIFQVYDMENREIADTITISDGTTYTIEGLYGYNDHVYIRLTDTGNVTYTYYYNLNSQSLTRLEWSDRIMDSRYAYWNYRTIALEEDVSIITMMEHNSTYGKTKIIGADQEWDMFSDKVSNEVSTRNTFPCVAKINDGKQYIYTFSARAQYEDPYLYGSSQCVVDLGQLLDSPTRQVESVPQGEYRADCASNNEGYSTVSGPMFPFNDGIIKMVGKPIKGTNRYRSGRIWWFPTEACLPMHIKGTTTTLNSYNNPVEWYCDQQLEFAVTNDLSRLLPQNGG